MVKLANCCGVIGTETTPNRGRIISTKRTQVNARYDYIQVYVAISRINQLVT